MTRSKKVRAVVPSEDDNAEVLNRLSEKPQIKSSIEKIREISPRLNSLSERASKEIIAVEAFLREAGIGVEAEACVDRRFFTHYEDEDRKIGRKAMEFLSLNYGRPNGTGSMAIFVERFARFDDSDPDMPCIYRYQAPWHQCPRDLRMRTYVYLPELLEAVVQAGLQQESQLSSVFGDLDTSDEVTS